MEAARSAYRVALDAVAGLPIRVLLTIGAELPMEMLGEVPSNVHVERFIPQALVLPHCAAVVTNGGSGSTLGALAAGVPIIAVGDFRSPSQIRNGQAVADRGAGRATDGARAAAARR